MLSASLALLSLLWPAGRTLADAVAEEGALRVAFIGDSLTFGTGLERPDEEGFPALVTEALRRRFPEAEVEGIVAADPGAVAWWGRTFFRPTVLERKPHVVVIQFGGNDLKAPIHPRMFAQNLRDFVATAREAGAEAVLVVPPFDGGKGTLDGLFADNIRAVGDDMGVPVADADAVLRAIDHDHRGYFALDAWGHPNWYGHLHMAREVYRAIEELLPPRDGLSLGVAPVSEITEEGSATFVPFAVSADSPGPVDVDIRVGDVRTTRRVRVRAADRPVRILVPVKADAAPAGGKPVRADRIQATAVRGPSVAFATGRLSVAPVLGSAEAALGTLELADDDWGVHEIGAEHIDTGLGSCNGPADLSARFSAYCDGRVLGFLVSVRDDQITVGQGLSQTDGDCVEVALDLNPASQRSLPYHTSRSLVVLASPPATQDSGPKLATLTPFAGSERFTAQCVPTEGGYAVHLRLPLDALGLSPSAEAIGFDVIIDDADGFPWRETQMVWAGEWDAALEATRYAILSLRPIGDGLVQFSAR